MKRLLAGFLALTALSAPAQAASQPQPATAPAAQPATAPAAPVPNVAPAMWVARDADTTIYMFGTFHALDGRRAWFNDEVLDAFNRSNELVVEVKLPTDPAQLQQLMGPLVMRLGVDPEGRTLPSVLTAEENTKLYELLAPLGVPAGAFDRMEPWFVSLTLVQAIASRMHLNPAHGPETILSTSATARNMPIGQLETADSQFELFDSTPRQEQIDGLKAMIADPEASLRTLEPMLAAWSRGDARGMARITMADIDENPTAYDRLFTHRNANWARWIHERMDRPGVVFMAVGAGHLVGRGSVQEQLQRLGIRSSRVRSR